MCFYIRNNEKEATLYEALEDITCYKLLYNNLQSPYLYYRYTLNKKVKSKLKIPKHINKKGNLQFKVHKKYDKGFNILTIEQGLHSYTNLKKARYKNMYGWDQSIFKCKIPKGSLFYKNNYTEEYVSNQLIVIKRVK